MKIVTLIEDLVYQNGLVAEHGLSIYIETENRKILFDTGQSGLFLQNAQKLGVVIDDVDCLVLSHGHHDHTGGLVPFLKKNNKAKVYAKNGIFVPKYSGQTRSIGTPMNEELLENRLIYVDSITEIGKNVFIMPEILLSNSTDTHFKGLNLKVYNEFVPDEFNEELFLVLKQNDQINIVTACSHRGITNICTTATEHFRLPVGLILGGFHTKNCTSEQYLHITNYLRQLRPLSIGVCHCTGEENYASMQNDLDTYLFNNSAGHEINIE